MFTGWKYQHVTKVLCSPLVGLILTVLVVWSPQCDAQPMTEERGNCVSLTDGERHVLSGVLKDVCPRVSSIYQHASGVLLPSTGTRSAGGSVMSYLARLNSTYGPDLQYFNSNRQRLIQAISRLIWTKESPEDTSQHLSDQVELLLCNALLPLCTYRSKGSVVLQQKSANSTNVSIGLELQQPTLHHLPTCEWICRNLQLLLPPATMLSVDPGRLKNTSLYRFLSLVAGSCRNSSTMPGQYVHCLNLTGSDKASVVEDVYPVAPASSMNSSLEIHTDGLPMMADPQRTIIPPPLFCVDMFTACGPGFVSTPVAKHWDQELLKGLKSVTYVARILLNASHSLLPFNESLKPCALECKSQVFSDKDVQLLGDFMLVATQITLVLAVFALLSFAIQWQRMSAYPLMVLFYMNFSALMATLGFSIRYYLPGGSKSLACHSDRSVLSEQPRVNDESSWCIVQFSLTYFFYLSSWQWWACFAHSWYVTFSQLKRRRDSVSASVVAQSHRRIMAVYHVAAWVPVLLLTVGALATRSVRGSTLYGFCWHGSGQVYLIFFILPLSISLLSGFFFMLLGMHCLWKARKTVKKSWKKASHVHRQKSQKKVLANADRYLIQMPIFLTVCLVVVAVKVALGVYEYVSIDLWERQLRTRLTCMQLTCRNSDICPPMPHGNVKPFLFKVLSICLFAWLTCSWALLSKETWHKWAHVLHIRRARAPTRSCSTSSSRPREMSGQVSNASVSTALTACNGKEVQEPLKVRISHLDSLCSVEDTGIYTEDAGAVPAII